MRRRASRTAAVLALALAVAGCAGDGSALVDEVMGPVGIQPTLASIQAHVFTPICTECHVPGGPGPMPLDSEAVSFQSLVDVNSVGRPALKRVAPGDPEISYLVHKIEGRATIAGQRMPPPPRAMLNPEQIAAIRDWIAAGAEP